MNIPSGSLLLILATLAFGLGIWLIGHGLLAVLGDLGRGIWGLLLRHFQPRTGDWRKFAKDIRKQNLLSPESETPGLLTATVLAILRYPIPVFLSVLLAVFINDWMMSALIVFIGVVISFSIFSRARRSQYNRVTDELEMLILQFVARYPLKNSVAGALADSADQLPRGLLYQAAANTATRLKLGDAQNPFRDLINIPHPVARRFAGVLIRAGHAAPDVFLDLLNQLRAETESRRELQQRIRRDLTLESVTISVLQVFLVISLAAVGLLPAWREYYVFAMANRVFYILMVALGVVGTIIGEYEIRYLEES